MNIDNCFVCGRPIGDRTNDSFPCIMKGAGATVLKVQDGNVLFRHRKCGPNSAAWVKLFGTSEINQLTYKRQAERTGYKVPTKPKDPEWKSFTGRVRYMLYMDTVRPDQKWTITYGTYAVEKGETDVLVVTYGDLQYAVPPARVLAELDLLKENTKNGKAHD